jgi:hypothetical protein
VLENSCNSIGCKDFFSFCYSVVEMAAVIDLAERALSRIRVIVKLKLKKRKRNLELLMVRSIACAAAAKRQQITIQHLKVLIGGRPYDVAARAAEGDG